MRIYQVDYTVVTKPNKGGAFECNENVNVTAINADRASEKVRKRVLKRHPAPYYDDDGVKTTYKNIAVEIDSVKQIAESDY